MRMISVGSLNRKKLFSYEGFESLQSEICMTSKISYQLDAYSERLDKQLENSYSPTFTMYYEGELRIYNKQRSIKTMKSRG